ncbi:MAG: serine/threonine-protein kinase [Chloroflexota bacterium]
MNDLIGQSLGRYHIRERLGEGGMATVYKAYDTRLERDVALKIIRTSLFAQTMLENVLKRFEREAKALAKMSHPHIVKVMDYGDHEGSPYLVMEYLPGGTLKQRVGKPIPWREAVQLILPIAQALEYAHAHNIIHRDIKPANILMTENNQPMLTDFGIAKILEAGDSLTGTGMGIGTPEYMAPEQWTGGAIKQSDIYSLGIVLYELIAGHKPYIADTPVAIMLKQVNDPLPRPKTFVPDLPDEVENVLITALTKKPEDRFPDIATFRSRLESLLSGAGEKKVAAAPAPEPVIATQKMPAVRPPAAPAPAPQPQPYVATQWIPPARPAAAPAPSRPRPVQPTYTVQPEPVPARQNQASLLTIGGITAVVVALICIVAVAGFVIQSEMSNRAEQTAAAQSTATHAAKLSTETEVARIAAATESALWATSTEVARIQTATEAAKLSTARAQNSTAAAFAQISTATAQAQREFLGGLDAEMTLVFGPTDGSLPHNADNTTIADYNTGVDLRDFALEATFINPYSTSVGTWDYGFIFRHEGTNKQFRLAIRSTKQWALLNNTGTPNGQVINDGTFSGLSTSAGGTNTVRLICFGTQGFLYINNVLVSELDLSSRLNSGDITIATGIYSGDEVNGYYTEYTDFTIWSLR